MVSKSSNFQVITFLKKNNIYVTLQLFLWSPFLMPKSCKVLRDRRQIGLYKWSHQTFLWHIFFLWLLK